MVEVRLRRRGFHVIGVGGSVTRARHGSLSPMECESLEPCSDIPSLGSGDRPASPTSGCSLEPAAAVGPSEILWLSESVPDVRAGFLSTLKASTPGPVLARASVPSLIAGTPGLGFLGPTGGLFKGLNGLHPVTTLVVLKRTLGFLYSATLGAVPFIPIFRGSVLAVPEVGASLGGSSGPPTFTSSPPSSLLPCRLCT